MGGSHRRAPRWLWLLNLTAVVGLGVAFLGPQAPAHASPAPPAPPADPLAAVSEVGPEIVDIDTQLEYQSAVGAGTGIVIDPNGVVLTNNHVIAGATDISARNIGNGQTYAAEVIGFDRTDDIAVVQLEGANGLSVADIGDSNRVQVGQPIVSLGNAGGVGGTPSAVTGRVIGLNQTVSAADTLTGSEETLDGLIQVDAPIRPGDSGGPTVNSAYQVIGVNTAASDNFKLGRGEGFAIPINQAMAIAGQIRAGAASPTVHIGPTAFLGVGVTDHGGNGAKVVRVLPDAPAAGAGLDKEDVITSIDGTPVDSATGLTNILDQHHPGDTVALDWYGPLTGGHTANVTLASGPPG